MKRITLSQVSCPTSGLYRADSTRYAVSAYGRTVAEARSRLFLVRQAEYRNIYASVKLLPPENHRHFLG